jgi:hypothetical protein
MVPSRAAPGPLSLLLGVGSAVVFLVLPLSRMAPPGPALTRGTIWLALAWYFAALLQMLTLQRRDWRGLTRRGLGARACWTWGLVFFALHVAAAFHYYHGWSHAHAVQHTRQVSGVGWGLYVSYAFAVLWLGDVAWWWLAATRYADRPGWIGWSLHAFLLFMVFNGTVVFETGPVRWAGLTALSVVAWWGCDRRHRC